MRLSLRVIDLYEEKAVTGNSHRLSALGQVVPKYQSIILLVERISDHPALGSATRTEPEVQRVK